MKWSNIEILDLLKAWLAISIAFAIAFRSVMAGFGGFLNTVAISAATVGTGFLLHELSHKYFAQKYGCRAEFRSFDVMLVLCIILSFFGFIFAAPGGVFIRGRISVRRHAVVAAAGPAVNIVLAAGFYLVAASTTGAVQDIASYGRQINSWLAVFNMLPFLMLDGAKVWKGNKLLFFVLMAMAVVVGIV